MKIETFKLDNQGLDNHTVYYVKITVGNKSYQMNVGAKSYEKLTELQNELQKLEPSKQQKQKQG